MLVNRKELARRIAIKNGYNIGDIEEVLEHLEDEIIHAVSNEEEVKLGKVFKIFSQSFPEKKAYNGLEKTYFTRPAKRVPKFKPLTRLEGIEFLEEDDEEGE